MRQVNFVIIFIFCLAFALFSIENTELGIIHLIPGVEVQAPISIELLIALGLGGVLAWLFSVWTHLERLIWSGQKVRQKNVRIQELECKIEEYQTQIQSLQPSLPPASDSITQEAPANA
ncbi:MAG: LapA family protein [Richelia sp. RM2_1_2]|nr:LapA family protein [Richelia sp. SM1_7_0]NJN08592.1 LapA family protein [Richelia sp. RM1_1_1]NJO61946.1 LapA family protein [Richelia sp. RM2_1_2]